MNCFSVSRTMFAQNSANTVLATQHQLTLSMRMVCPSITKAACQRLLRSRRYTRTSPSSIRCVSSRNCRMSCSSTQQYGRTHQQVYQSVCLREDPKHIYMRGHLKSRIDKYVAAVSLKKLRKDAARLCCTNPIMRGFTV